MSLLDRLPRRVRRYVLLCDAVARLGPAWTAFRVRFWIENRLDLLERRTPASPWPALVTGAPEPTIIDVEALRAWLREHCSDERVDSLRQRAANVAARRFDVFGQVVELDDSHHDARDGHTYDRDKHWSRVRTPLGADLKYVWEPSRFGWIFDLVRLHLIDPESCANSIFWDALDEWCDQNPPNLGVNWACGQEASIRLMAVVIAASGMRDAATSEQMEKVQRLAWVTAARVEGNIAYARSQRNNHHASEAVGLLTVALLFPGHADTVRWRELGERHLKEVCGTLVFDDGGTSQYSTNYHRVFVHNFVWAVQAYRSAGLAEPSWLRHALEQSGRVLDALTEPISGSGPFFGHDDGARLLPLSSTPHRNLSEDARLIDATRGASGVAGESARWFAEPNNSTFEASRRNDASYAQSFEDFGVHVLAAGDVRAFVRCGTYRFRPAQDDLLNCDVWVDGVNVLPDSGTATYRWLESNATMLDGSDAHNGPRLASSPVLRRASRFLWARWPNDSQSSTRSVGGIVTGSFSIIEQGRRLDRTVEVSADHVSITDGSAPKAAIVVRWLVEDLHGIASDWAFTTSPVEVVPSETSPGYGRTRRCERLEVRQSGPIVAMLRRSRSSPPR